MPPSATSVGRSARSEDALPPVRLFHPDATTRGRTAILALKGRPYREPWHCPTCGILHATKTYHIKVDSDGFAYVSGDIWKRMVESGATGGFELANATRGKPPTQMIGVGGAPLRLDTLILEG